MLLILLLLFIALDLCFWRAADRRLRPLRRARLWRRSLTIFMGVMILYILSMLIWPVGLRRSGGPVRLPITLHATVYIWHFLALPIVTICLFFGAMRRGLLALIAGWKSRRAGRRGFAVVPSKNPGQSAGTTATATLSTASSSLRPAPTRRQVIAAAAMAIPPLTTCATAVGSLRNLYGHRIQPFKLTLPQLPRALDGMTITHVSDTHIGKFLHPDRLPAIAEDINKLDSDFIVFTGDLIDLSLDDLPYGIEFLRSLKSRCGIAICEGNHDLMQNRGEFESAMIDAGLPLIIGDQLMLSRHSRDGRSFPVQFLAVPWNVSDGEMSDAVQVVTPLVRPDAFSILLAHHPHSFDAAAAAGFPLTLSGHTHGGQIMMTSQVGLGSIRFRYTSGLYKKPGSQLIVNNGLGNWFPLRVNAPAELVHITLHHGGA